MDSDATIHFPLPKPYIPNDKWSRKAAAEGYRARSVYKLMELDEKFRLLKPGMVVLDLGAAPGSWMQYASQKVGNEGWILGFDLTEILPVEENVIIYEQDITDIPAMDAILAQQKVETVDLVLSDIAPSTSGVKDVDQWKSIELGQAVITLAQRYLKPHGKCVLKVFRGSDFDAFLAELKRTWKEVRVVTVQASRDRSREVYLVMTK